MGNNLEMLLKQEAEKISFDENDTYFEVELRDDRLYQLIYDTTRIGYDYCKLICPCVVCLYDGTSFTKENDPIIIKEYLMEGGLIGVFFNKEGKSRFDFLTRWTVRYITGPINVFNPVENSYSPQRAFHLWGSPKGECTQRKINSFLEHNRKGNNGTISHIDMLQQFGAPSKERENRLTIRNYRIDGDMYRDYRSSREYEDDKLRRWRENLHELTKLSKS
jgi:hypothetical protein